VTPERRQNGDKEIQRFLPDRRSGAERRADADRRRAHAERRAPADRRRPSAAQFSWEDTLRIHRMLADPRTAVACPRCDGALLLGPAEPRSGIHTREVHCTGCRYSVAVVEDGRTVSG
jgi:hypothetical protein